MMGSMEVESKPGRRWPTYVAVGIVFVVLYVLSSGPVLVLAGRAIIPPVPTVAFYRPIYWATKGFGFERQYINYLKWWFRLTDTVGPPSLSFRTPRRH
jgi:hypothetical protein